MRSSSQKSGDGGAVVPRMGRVNNGIIPNSFRTLSGYLRIVSSGASTVASTVRSAASAMVERDAEVNHDQVSWAGFDKLELEGGITRQVLLLAFGYGFQIWDVEVADNVRNLVTRHDGPVSFMQMLPKPVASGHLGDKFAESRPLLIICADGTFSGVNNVQEGSDIPRNGSIQQSHGPVNESQMPTFLWFYSLRSRSYVDLLRFRSAVLVVRCSSRMVAVLQSTQIHCLNAATLEREYVILTNPVPAGCYASGDIGFGPLAVGPRWMAYSGTEVIASDSGRVIPQHLTPSPSFPCPASNGSLVAHYAKESSKHLATGIATLGDMGYKKLSRYYSDQFPEGKNCMAGTACGKAQSISNGHSMDADSIGMVIVRDIVSKTVIAQFRAHKSPILSLCFDPSGTLLVTASVQGHNINVFRIMPGLSGDSGAASGSSYVHLYRLQRGLTNAVIRDISFSSDSCWIMISSSRGTSHLFAISPSGGLVSIKLNDAFSYARNSGSSLMQPSVHLSPNSGLQVLMQQNICASGPPITLSAVSRIRNGSSGWKNTVTGAAAAATGRVTSISAAIASAFHNCKSSDMRSDANSLNKNYHLLVFSQSGSMVQYTLRISPADNGVMTLPAVSANIESNLGHDGGVTVEAIQKWGICQKQNRRERGANMDIYGENGSTDSSNKVHPERMKSQNDALSDILAATCSKEKITAEERHQMYISEVELQMHQNRNPLWTRSEIYFQSVLDDVSIEEDSCGGEIEIEKVPVQIIEARAKELVPVFNYLHTPKRQLGRISDVSRDNNGDCDIANRSSSASVSGSLNSIAYAGILDNECDNSVSDETGQTAPLFTTETSTGFVHTNDTRTQKTDSKSVNNKEGFAEGDPT